MNVQGIELCGCERSRVGTLRRCSNQVLYFRMSLAIINIGPSGHLFPSSLFHGRNRPVTTSQSSSRPYPRKEICLSLGRRSIAKLQAPGESIAHNVTKFLDLELNDDDFANLSVLM